METKAKPKPTPVFKSRDGREHVSERAATLRNKTLDAYDALNEAIKAVENRLRDEAKTADGHYLSDVSTWAFYRVRNDDWYCPGVETIYCLKMHGQVDVEDDSLVILHYRNDGKYERYKVSEIYVDEKKAQQAAIALGEERLAELTGLLAARKAKYGA